MTGCVPLCDFLSMYIYTGIIVILKTKAAANQMFFQMILNGGPKTNSTRFSTSLDKIQPQTTTEPPPCLTDSCRHSLLYHSPDFHIYSLSACLVLYRGKI